MSQIEALSVTSKELRQETSKDIELCPLLKALREGKDLQGREAQYTIEDGCIMYGQRVCIPRKFRKNVLEELHTGHLGIVKMMAIARSFVYWKNIDKDIEEAAKNCVDCARYKADLSLSLPKSKFHYWGYPSMPWERIHVDFAGPIFEHTFFQIVDAHSKWLEVCPMKVTTTKETIECLRDSFARFGLPRVLVSDNGSQFTSYEFQRFMHKNGVKHKTSAPFKPSSNGQAERYVATLKQSLRAMYKYEDNFEFRDSKFDVGDRVAVRVYRAANTRWKFGTIVNQDGVLPYIIDVQGTLVRRHVELMRLVGDKVQENIIPIIHQRFPSAEIRENNSNIQHAETAEDISKDLNNELGSSSVQGVPSTDVAVPDLSQSSTKETDSETRSAPVPDRPFPRCSGRISPKVPSNIKAGYLNCKVRPYIPNPLRCFKCQRFGNSQTSCRGQLTYSRCASVGHASTDCSLEPKCINCLQPHPSNSKLCPKWKIEKQIQEIKTTQNISYPEARKLIVPQLHQTYAQATKSSTLNNSTQTDENITKTNCPPLKLLAPLSSKQRTNIPTAINKSSSAQTQLLPSISSKKLLYRIQSHQLPCLRQKGKLKNNHLYYIVPEKIT
ncbi:uncharacterized protein K02A2.6 [Trichonephila clavipes]|nr:uncharacterized protein K02A2.6 [Trichonephila clavipes]